VAAVLAAAGGMLYSPQVTIISPHNMRVEESIMMVVWVAVGGRGRLWGAILGSLVVNYSMSSLTSDLPSVWPFVQGGLFIGVVLLFPQGLVGLWDKVESELSARRGVARAMLPALPLAALCAFILGEALGMMPKILQTVVFAHGKVGRLSLKYVVLVGLLVLAAVVQAVVKRRKVATVADGDVAVSGAVAVR
jgi:hypothetical protein